MRNRQYLMMAVFLFSIAVLIYACGTGAQQTQKTETVDTTPTGNPPGYTGRWGPDSLETIKNYSLYREFYKQGAIQDALPYWHYVIENAPEARKTPYIDGGNMYETLAEQATDETVKKAYIDSMLMMYDKRMEYFGEEGELSAYKALKVKKHLPDNEALYNKLILASVDIAQEDAPYYVLLDYLKIKRSEQIKDGKIDKEGAAKVMEEYAKLSDIVESNIEAENENADNYEKTQAKLDVIAEEMEKYIDIFNEPKDCAGIIAKYEPEYRSNSNDLKTIKKLMSRLAKGRCTTQPLYAELNNKLFELQPTAAGARKLAGRYYKEGNTELATKYFLQAIELESNNSNKAKIYMNLATIERRKVSSLTTSVAVQARKYALQAADLQPGWGKPYLFIGDLYASSGKLCGSGTGWESQRVSWAATDMWLKAKDIDPDVTSEANQSINKYSQYYPTVQEGFMRGGVKNGDRVPLSDCWIGGSTTARLK
ncbi:MAG: hypothetical protein R3E32_21430 [Chitinophagales bacterium]